MRRYVITLLILALSIGALFRAGVRTGFHMFEMFGAVGIVMFGLVGTLGINRLQSGTGLKELETALKSLEPEWILTDWAFQGHGKPDFLSVGPIGMLAVFIEEVAQSASDKKVVANLAKGWARAGESITWLKERSGQPDLPVYPVLVLTRRVVTAPETVDGVLLLNPNQLLDYVATLSAHVPMERAARIKLTRTLREA
jgi:hypothetical protein